MNWEANRYCTYCGMRLVEESAEMARMVVLNPSNGGREYSLSGPSFRIGRSRENELVLDEDQVSGHHALMFYWEGVVWMEDLGSRSGTYVNGERVDRCVPLHDKDLIEIGTMTLQLKTPEVMAEPHPLTGR